MGSKYRIVLIVSDGMRQEVVPAISEEIGGMPLVVINKPSQVYSVIGEDLKDIVFLVEMKTRVELSFTEKSMLYQLEADYEMASVHAIYGDDATLCYHLKGSGKDITGLSDFLRHCGMLLTGSVSVPA